MRKYNLPTSIRTRRNSEQGHVGFDQFPLRENTKKKPPTVEDLGDPTEEVEEVIDDSLFDTDTGLGSPTPKPTKKVTKPRSGDQKGASDTQNNTTSNTQNNTDAPFGNTSSSTNQRASGQRTSRTTYEAPLTATEGQARTYLSFQKVYFPQRIPKKGDAQRLLVNYFPYVELKKRTIPLPSVPEYLLAISREFNRDDVPSRFVEAFGKKGNSNWATDPVAMFSLAEEVFSNAVILLCRQNRNTQIIFPGKSTTSYEGRGKSGVKNYVWTNSVEFNSFDFSELPVNTSKALTMNDDYNTSDKTLGKVVEETVYGKVTKVLQGSFTETKMSYAVNLELTNSLWVAQNYIAEAWLGDRVVKARKKLNYKVLVFFDQTGRSWTDGNGDTHQPVSALPKMELQFMFGYNLGESVARGGGIRDWSVEEIKPLADQTVEPINQFRNPRKSLPMKNPEPQKLLPTFEQSVSSRTRRSRFR